MAEKPHVLVLGRGVAGTTSAWLLARDGFTVTLAGAAPRSGGWVVLNDTTRHLLRELWEDETLLAGAHAIGWRSVAWEVGSVPRALPAPSSVVALSELCTRLEGRLLDRFGDRLRSIESEATDPPDFVLHSTGRAAGPATHLAGERHQYGTRTALCARLRLRGRLDTSWLESTPDGWLFACPCGDGTAILQAVLPGPPADPSAALERLVSGARLGSRLENGAASTPVVALPVAPANMAPPCGPGWLAVGDAALAFDPVSGDGTGQALRGAILASAVLDALARGADEQQVLAHYALRLKHALLAHLGHCVHYYLNAACRAAFQHDIAAMQRVLATQAADERDYGFVLRGTRLVPASVEQPVPRSARAPASEPSNCALPTHQALASVALAQRKP